EHYGGEFPLWMATEQVRVLPVADRHNDYAREVVATLRSSGIRAELDERTESVGRKVRDAGMQRTPVVLVVGDGEVEAGTVTVNRRGVEDRPTVALSELLEQVTEEVRERRISDHVLAALNGESATDAPAST
ncbi:MAG: thrS, partial [Thermoleophilia bacterium]|nr:thrS [Thermoleophilia bacterium]